MSVFLRKEILLYAIALRHSFRNRQGTSCSSCQKLEDARLEKGLLRPALSLMSGVPVPTIAKFEQQYTISLASYVALAKALGYTDAIKALLAEPRFTTMEELETIHKNKNRKKGRNVFNK